MPTNGEKSFIDIMPMDIVGESKSGKAWMVLVGELEIFPGKMTKVHTWLPKSAVRIVDEKITGVTRDRYFNKYRGVHLGEAPTGEEAEEAGADAKKE